MNKCACCQVMVVYNPLGWIRNDVVRIPVSRSFLLLACFSFTFQQVNDLDYYYIIFNRKHQELDFLQSRKI